MAVFDPAQNAVVIRIVYDGPPHAGKTTSVRSLAQSLSRTVETPLESNGRTMFFDWMEYTGGLFEGHQIRCQIVSVPGQPDLAARRRALLESADVVVFVADTADRDSVARSVGHVRQMTEILARGDGPPIGVVLQANKRDLPTAIPRKELAEAFGADYARAAVTESVADKNMGIRETFVLAVRLALDRIRDLMARGLLPEGTPSVNSAEQLLERLEAIPVPPSPRMSDRTDDEPDGDALDPDDSLALPVERPMSALGEPVAKPGEPARIPLAIPPPPPPLEPAFLGNAPKPVAHAHDVTDDTWDMPELAGEATDKAHVATAINGTAINGIAINGVHARGAEPSDDEAIDRAIDEVLENAARVEAERGDDDIPAPIEARPSRADTEVSADLAARAVTDITNHEALVDDEPPPPPPKRAATSGEDPHRPHRPRSPDARVPSGAIWPPVEGRIVLHEAVATGLIVHRVGQADWIAGIGTGWRVHSSASAEYSLFDDGRRALLHWARLHSSYAELLSPGRCVVLADAGGDTWRLWQIVKLMPSLRAWLVDSSDEEPRELFRRLTTAAIVLGEAWARCADTRLLPSLDSIGRGPSGPQFVALMPVVGQGALARPTDVADRVTRELTRLLAAELVERRPDLLALLEGNDRPTTPWEELVAHAVTALV